MMKAETIVAPATALSESGIGIIRLSGVDAIQIAGRYFSKLKEMKTHTIHYGFIMDGDEAVDEVMVSLMKSPNSYTREDVVEINCHGSVMVMNRIMDMMIRNGARLAEPGEFTKKAFLNGRIDLAEAEAVMDVIRSKSEFALKASLNQLTGKVSDVIRLLREDIIYQVAYIESALDDPEHRSLEGYMNILQEKVADILERINLLIKSSENGKILKEGINTVIVGKPNVGKSSFLNLLTGDDRAIVTDIAGTTRDILEESVKVNGVMLNIIDTAGIRTTEDTIEKIGVEKAMKSVLQADLIVYIIDSSIDLDENDRKIRELIKDRKVIVLLNKTDLETKVDENDLRMFLESGDKNYPQVDNFVDKPIIIKISVKENTGFDQFSQVILDMFIDGGINREDVFITNLRHQEALRNAYDSMLFVNQSLEAKMPEDFYTIDMMSAYEYLGMITGDQIGEDLITEIFSKFCTGK